MTKLWLLPAILLGMATSWPQHAVTAISGLSCTHQRVWVCSEPAQTATATIHLNSAAQAWMRHGQLPLSYLGTRGSMHIQSTPVSQGASTITVSVSQPTELLIGSTQHPSAVLYLEVPHLPPWPTRPLRITPPAANLPPPTTFAAPLPKVYWNAIQRANHLEGMPPLTLPRNYSRLSPADQLFVIANLERVVHGLWPLYGVSPTLNRAAAEGVRKGTDPTLVGDRISAWGSNWYSATGALQATYSWMYDDGYGSQNIDCRKRGAGGCWGHRDNILGNWGPYGVFGGAILKPLFGKSGTAEVFRMNFSPKAIKHISYTWKQAVKNGARPSGL